MSTIKNIVKANKNAKQNEQLKQSNKRKLIAGTTGTSLGVAGTIAGFFFARREKKKAMEGCKTLQQQQQQIDELTLFRTKVTAKEEYDAAVAERDEAKTAVDTINGNIQNLQKFFDELKDPAKIEELEKEIAAENAKDPKDKDSTKLTGLYKAKTEEKAKPETATLDNVIYNRATIPGALTNLNETAKTANDTLTIREGQVKTAAEKWQKACEDYRAKTEKPADNNGDGDGNSNKK